MKLILHFIKKEFLQFKRDPKMFGIILISPIIQLILLGYAVNMDVERVHTSVLDLDKTKQSTELISEFSSTNYFQINYYPSNYTDLQDKIDKGKSIMGIVIPKGYGEKIKNNSGAEVQFIFDGSDGNSASISMGYAQAVVRKHSEKIISRVLKKSPAGLIPSTTIEAKTRVWFNPELKTRIYMVPAIVGLLIMVITIILTSLAIVKEKEIGTLEQLIVTPLKSYQMILGKLIPFLILGFVSIAIVLLAMMLIFGIYVKGSITFLILSAFVFILSTLGLGLFVSTITSTQQQAMMIAIFVILLPMVYLSGFAFPIENMPQFIQYITYLIPLRYFISIVRGVILKGVGFAELWMDFAALLFFGISILYLSSKRFKSRIE